MSAIFLDTYAIFQIINGNTAYEQYKRGFRYLTTQFNLIELYYNLRRIGIRKEEAQKQYKTFEEFEISVNNNLLIEAAEFRLQHKSKKLSYADCMGYVTARALRVPFLTGDPQFENIEGVIFLP